MSTEQHIARLQHSIERFNAQDWDAYFALYDEDVVGHGFPPGLPSGLEGLRHFYGAVQSAFVRINIQLDDLVAQGDRVAARYTFRATHVGPFMDIPATGRQVAVEGITLFRFQQGKVVERWQRLDDLGLLQQLGALPAPDQADPLALSREIYDCFSRNELDSVLDLAADDVEVTLVPFGQTFHGKQGLMDFMRGFKDAFPDISINITNQFAAGGKVVNEFTAQGTHTGPLQTPAGTVPPTGRAAHFTVCEVLEWQDGKLRRLHNYQDVAGLMQQLGLMPEPA